MSLYLQFTLILMITSDIVSCTKSNFVLFLTDDQDLLLNGMVPMKSTVKHIANEGLTFTDAYVHSPICCPSRSSLLTGKYLHNLHIFNNSINGNCSSPEWQLHHEPKSIAALLKPEGYINFYAGKYLNKYGNKHTSISGHVPPGYDWWYGLEGNSRYYNYTLCINGTRRHFQDEYLTDLMKDFANDFLENKPPKGAFFMTLATPAAHAPFTAAPRHLHKFPNVLSKKTKSFNVTAKNKHWLLQLSPHNLPKNVDILDDIQRKRMQTLLAVDELVGFIVRKLQELKILEETYLIFTSDNGFHIGQFSLPWDKRQLYQTDIHVPFLMRGPGIAKKAIFDYPVSLVDIAPTILDLAQVKVPGDMDGVSFAYSLLKNKLKHEFSTNETVLKDNNLKLRREYVVIEYYGEGNAHTVQKECNFTKEEANDLAECSLENWCKCQDSRNNTYNCILDFRNMKKFKYCLFEDDVGFVEAYDLIKDQNELHNIWRDLPEDTHRVYQKLIMQYDKCSGKTCRNI